MILEAMAPDAVYIQLPKVFLNQSRWKAYQDCDRLYGWDQIEGLAPDRPRRPLITGTAVHKAQVAIHKNGINAESIKEATQAAQEYFRLKMTPSGPQLMGDEASILEGVNMLGNILPGYFRHWAHLGQVWKPLGQELAFCVEVGENTNVFLVGTIDNLVTLDGNLWLVDYKTMAKLDMREFLKYEMDIQLTAYIYGGTKQLTLDARKEGKPPVWIRGAIIDGLIKTTIPQYHREMFTRSIQDLKEFEVEFCMKAWEMASKEAMVKGNRSAYNLFRDKMFDIGHKNWKVAFPKNTQQCFRYGTCDFRDLCAKDNEVRRAAFHKRTPDYVDAAAAKLPMPTEKE